MSSTARIDINGQLNAGCCGTGDITVSRSMPAILAGKMEVFSWHSFCDKLDDALKPAGRVKKILCITLGTTTFLTFLLWFMGFVRISSTFGSFDNGGTEISTFLPFAIGVIIMMVGMIGMAIYSAVTKSRVRQNMMEVCEEQSALYPGISFHVRYDMHVMGWGRDAHVTSLDYIEVNVAHDAGYVAPEPSAPVAALASAPIAYAVSPSEPEIVAGGTKSAAERMRDLEQLKSHLTEEEYERKRAEILSSV